jgi:2-phospho-L-lactate guanylyltransferase
VLAEVWVISVDPAVLALAEQLGARIMRDTTSELNAALGQARDTLSAAGAAAMLVIPADVPLITAADIAALASGLRNGASLALATDRQGGGTNALGMRLPSDLPFLFGEQSAALHQAAALRGGLRLARYASPTISLDVDDPESLAYYGAHAAPCMP